MTFVALLAGCSAPVPDDAVAVTNDALPGGTMHVWLDAAPDRTVFHGVFTNDSGRLVTIRDAFHLGPWDLTVLDEAGTEVRYHMRTQCREFDYKPMGDGTENTFRFTWQHVVFASPQPCESGQVPPFDAAAPGNYTAVIRFRLAYEDADSFRAELPFVVPDASQ